MNLLFSRAKILSVAVLTVLSITTLSSCNRPGVVSISDYNPDEYFNPQQSPQENNFSDNNLNSNNNQQKPSESIPQKPTEQKLESNQAVQTQPMKKNNGKGLELELLPGPENLRVLIFPHIGPYAIPQGRETVLDKVTISSKEPCDLINAKTNALILVSNRISLNANELPSHTKIQCDKTFKVERETGLIQIEYRGTLYINVNQLNKKTNPSNNRQKYLSLILHLPFEEYLRGVVPSEMPASWPKESLKAQAIAARTYAQYQIQYFRPASTEYDFDDTVLYQAFLGVNREHPRTDEAILATKSQVLTYGGNPIQAFFSADSGGYTESSENVWMKYYPYCPSKPEVYDLNLVKNDWKYTSTVEKIEKELRTAKLIKGNSTLREMEITKRSQSGRATEIKLFFQDGTTQLLFGVSVQTAMKLRSNFFEFSKDLTTEVPTYNFLGKGYGHGVGMNQWGARTLSQHLNWDYQRILFFYYKN